MNSRPPENYVLGEPRTETPCGWADEWVESISVDLEQNVCYRAL